MKLVNIVLFFINIWDMVIIKAITIVGSSFFVVPFFIELLKKYTNIVKLENDDNIHFINIIFSTLSKKFKIDIFLSTIYSGCWYILVNSIPKILIVLIVIKNIII